MGPYDFASASDDLPGFGIRTTVNFYQDFGVYIKLCTKGAGICFILFIFLKINIMPSIPELM